MSEATIQQAPTPDHRTLGFFHLSIATSLAIEGIVGIHPDLPPTNKMPLKQYDDLWVNLRTLFRNIFNACDKATQEGIDPPEMTRLLLTEMETIPDMLKEYAGKPVKVTYYYSDYKNLEEKYPYAKLRSDNTTKQMVYTDLLIRSMAMMHRDHKERFLSFPDLITTHSTTNSLIITHLAYDLLALKNFDKLTLLESHTGKTKSSSMFYTKYYGGKELSMIPFTEELLQVFGDKEMFHPMEVSLRKALIEIAKRRQWSSVTTRARIVACLAELPSALQQFEMKKIYHSLV